MEASDYFVELDIETDGQTLADEAVERLQDRWPGWEPNDADLEVVQIEALAPMAENAAEVCALMPPAVFREYGQKLIGRPYGAGEQAVGALTFTFIDNTGYVIPADTEIDIDGFAFTTDVETSVPVGTLSASGVTVHAVVASEDANNLTGDSVTQVTGIAGIDDITLDAPTSGGSEPESDADYQSGLSRDLQLQAKTIITTRDFELWSISKTGVGRALAVHTGDRAVTVVVTTVEGEIVAAPIKAELVDEFAEFRLVNTIVTMLDPTYTTVNASYTVKALPGFDPTDLDARIDAALAELLSPAGWGMPKGASILRTWVHEPVVRANLIIDRIGDVEGANYVVSVTLTAVPRTGVTGVASTDLLTLANHGFEADQRVVLSTLAGGAGLSNGTVYFVKAPTTNTFQLSATAGGAALNFTTDITGATGIAPASETNGDLKLVGLYPLPRPGAMTGTIT